MFGWAYQHGLSAVEQYFPLTANQPQPAYKPKKNSLPNRPIMQGWSHPYGKVWRLPYLNFPASPSPKSLPTISAYSRSICCAELVFWMFWKSLWILNTSIWMVLGVLGSSTMWALVCMFIDPFVSVRTWNLMQVKGNWSFIVTRFVHWVHFHLFSILSFYNSFF
jgi:hypothetical protein